MLVPIYKVTRRDYKKSPGEPIKAIVVANEPYEARYLVFSDEFMEKVGITEGDIEVERIGFLEGGNVTPRVLCTDIN